MRIFRRPRNPGPSLDYGKIADFVHERRNQKRREPGQEHPCAECSPRVVRTYRPGERLKSIEEQTRKLTDDAEDLPRTWDPDLIPPDISRLSEFNFVSALVMSVLVTATLILEVWSMPEASDAAPPMATMRATMAVVLVSAGALLWISISGAHHLRRAAWVGIIVAVFEIAVAFAMVLVLGVTGLR